MNTTYSNKPKYREDIEDKPCVRRYIRERKDGSKTAYLHYIDGMEVYEYCPDRWVGWKFTRMFIGEKEVW